MDAYTPSGSQICSAGIVKTLFTENKFTIHDCWVEIYQNSDDAGSKEMIVEYIEHNDTEFLMIADNGCGMTMEQIDNSLNLLKRGSKSGEKHGKFNFGGKAAILQFSGIADFINSGDKNYKGMCIVQSKSNDSPPVCYEMVGRELIEKGWAGTVQPAYLDSERESVTCSKLWEKYPIKGTGTNIFIQVTQSMKDQLTLYRDGDEKGEGKWGDLQLACNERLNHCKVTMYTPEKDVISFKPIIDKENIIRQKFLSIPIHVYLKDGKYLFVVFFKELVKNTTKEIEHISVTKIIKPMGKKWSKNLETIEDTYLNGYENIGEFKMEIGCNFTYKVDENFDDTKSNNNIHIIRNGFCLNHFNNPYCDKKTRSGDFYIRRIWKNMKSTISYDTKKNGDKLDKIIGVNMHKADIKWDKLPINLQRTIRGILDINGNKIVKYIQKVEYNPTYSKKKITDFNGTEKYEKWLEHLPKYKVKLHKKNVCGKWKKYKTLIQEQAPAPKPAPAPAHKPTPSPAPKPTPSPAPKPAPAPAPKPTPSPAPKPAPSPAPTPSLLRPPPKKVSQYYKGIVPREKALRYLKDYIQNMEKKGLDFDGVNLEIINKIISAMNQ